MSRTSLLILILLTPPAIVAVVERSQEYPKRYAEVIPGSLYRSAFPSGEQIRNLAHDKGIRTILRLTGEDHDPKYKEERQVAAELGLRFETTLMPGDGCGKFEDLDRAADIVGDPRNWPVLFHCAAGKQRSNAVLAAYRMKKCQWTVDKALAELEAGYGLDREAEQELVEHLRAYAETR
ncbi:MAG: hypothetical protein ABII12_15105 [Planctomycetota bacterium]